MADLVVGTAVATPPAATAAAREELGGEAEGADWFVAGGVGVAPWAGVLSAVAWIRELVCEGVAFGEVLVKFWLLHGGVVLHWGPHPWGKLWWVGWLQRQLHKSKELGWQSLPGA